MLLQPSHHHDPFPFFCLSQAFSEAQCAALEALFVQPGEWQHRDGAFYSCSLRDVTANIHPAFLANVRDRMRDITGLLLADHLVVTAQLMNPGQAIGVHSDRPLPGYEIARLVLQLNRHWREDHGGVLALFATPDSQPVFRINPGYNNAFGFVLHADSYHAVSEVTQLRRSIVFNFWHAGNSAELADYVQALFAKMHFSSLPRSLDPVAVMAESHLSEEATLQASTAASALHLWGYDEATIITGYRHSVGVAVCNSSNPETCAAVRLADWVAFLYQDSFDILRWQSLRDSLKGSARFERLMRVWQLCLPDETTLSSSRIDKDFSA